MADFKTALEALSQGKLDIKILGAQIDKLLESAPKHANRLLAQLEDAYERKLLDEKQYAAIKGQINSFRRAHAKETEGGEAATDSTVFAQEDNYESGTAASEAPTAAAPSKPKAGDATEVLPEDERGGEPMSQSAVDFDISVPSDSSAPSSIPSATGPTGTAWQEPKQAAAVMGRELGPGDVIKERFKLLEVLGVGGMGKVYKGIDLLKEEARDKNPYMAIKLLNEDFKSHPEAFIALQRESSRQQKLAHPNIATVYDFDRIGGPGTPVFITMELMEGQPLNTYIKKTVRKAGGLPFPEAYTIVAQLGAALRYAHDRRLVHSDFKPGNAFLCNDGTVKTLDFGIARAVKNPVTGEAEKTLFDPGKLGALTPAYASLEMLEGEEPDPRDDIYALGCVAYELLTGKHPFNKLPATTARDNGLVPAPIKGIPKKSNRALRHALAFKREDRSENVEDFVEEFEGKANWHKNPFVIAAAVLIVLGIGLIPTLRTYLHNKAVQQDIAELNTGDRQTIVAKLNELPGMSKPDQSAITDGAKDAIQNYFSSEIARDIDISGENYNFPAAEELLKQVSALYPDSRFVIEQTDEINFNKKQKITDLYNNYIAALKDPNALDSTKDILKTIQTRIDPNHPLLTDPRPANAYRLAAEQVFADGNYQQALAYIDSGLQTAPDDARLKDLQAAVQNAIRVAELNQTLTAAQPQLASLDDYKQHQADILELANLSTPQKSPVLTDLATGLKTAMATRLDEVLKQGTRADADSLASEYGDLLSSLSLNKELTQIKLAHLSGEERTQAIQTMVNSDSSTIEEKLASPALDNADWESGLLASVRELDSLKDEDASAAEKLKGYRDTIAKLYSDKASELLKANRFDAADGYVNRGERYAPDIALLQDTRTQIAQSKAEFEKQLRINDLKDQFRQQTEADRVAEAQTIFNQLKGELAADDPYITTQAPAILADSYSRLAQRRAESKDFDAALKLAEAGLELNPSNPVLKGIRDEYRVEVNIAELGGTFKNAGVFTPDEVQDLKLKVNQIETSAPGRYSEFRAQSETALAARINALAQTNQDNAAALANAAYLIFPTSSVLSDLKDRYQLQPWPNRAVAEAALNSGELSRATQVLQEATAGEFAGHPDVLAMQKALENKVKQANDAFTAFNTAKEQASDKFNELRQAKKLLGRAQLIWVDNPDYDKAETDIDQLIANAPDNPAKKIIQVEKADIAATSSEDLKAAQANWQPIPSDRECAPNLAGYGRRSRAVCFDYVYTGWRGPMMVVVPAGGDISSDFAIGKYEISVADWSKYCALSGTCKPELNKERFNDPMTGITLQQAEEYVKWLSDRTGKNYRLPTPEEWQYAASEGGKLTADSEEFKAIKGQLNCRVTMGDKILKGTGIASIRSGRSNAWGLYNFVGNVQEWVLDPNGKSEAVGGSFSDMISNCDLTTSRDQGGSADGSTGFRVVLEDVG